MSSQPTIAFLPGYHTQIKPKTNNNKAHLFDLRYGAPVQREIRDVRSVPQIAQRAFPASKAQSFAITRVPEGFMEPVATRPPGDTSTLPAWVSYDRKVLRFYAYFKEAVFSSPVEQVRLRRCILYYYLEDDSIHIAEPKQENAGIPQGIYVKRHRIPKGDRFFIGVNDLSIGASLTVYGRTFTLYDCDDFTRAFYSEMGICLSAPQPCPSDSFAKKHSVEEGTFKKQMNPMKEHVEAMHGKNMGVDVQAAQKFFQNDGKVLRFFCVWRDQKMYGEVRPYVLHYFLADDTVEVLEVKQANSGRDAFPAMLKRSKLPLNHAEGRASLANIGKNTEHVRFYTEKEIIAERRVNVFGRQLEVCEVDEFTRRYFITNLGMAPEQLVFPSHEPEPEPPLKLAAPPYTGFGTEEDSMSSFLYLNPKVPKQDFKQIFENTSIQLRFLAKFVDPAPEDQERRFIITYFMGDHTISIFERFARNSGFIGGKFKERAKMKDPVTGFNYTQADLCVGKQIELCKFKFELLECDDYTKKFMRDNPTHFSEESVAQAVAALESSSF